MNNLENINKEDSNFSNGKFTFKKVKRTLNAQIFAPFFVQIVILIDYYSMIYSIIQSD